MQPSSNKSGQTALELLAQRNQQNLARKRLDNAFALRVARNDDAARAALSEAVRTDPNLSSDGGAVGLASHLHNLPYDQASAYLFKESQKPLDGGRTLPTITFGRESWASLAQMATLFGVAVLLSAILLIGMTRSGVTPWYGDMAVGSLKLHTPLTLTFGNILLTSIRDGVLWTFCAGIALVMMFIMGTLIGGTGLVGDFTRQVGRAYLFFFLIVCAGSFVFYNRLYAANGDAQSGLNFAVVAGWIIYVGVAIMLFGQITAARRAHKMGFVRSFFTAMFGNAIFGIGVAVFGLLRISSG